MQRIEIVHEVSNLAPTPERYLEYEQAAEEDFITDEDEIRATIRRVVTMSWKDSVFTLDELHGHLIKNFVKYPVPAGEEQAWLEGVIYDLWRSQKEMARVAGVAMPTIINTKIEGKHHFGIIEPITETGVPELDVAPALVSPAPEVKEADDQVQLVVVESKPEQQSDIAELDDSVSPELDITPPTLRPSEVAARIFDEYTKDHADDSEFDMTYLMNLFKTSECNAEPKDVRSVIKTMEDSGYIHSYTTGKKKSQRTWWRMDADVKADVLADMADGSFGDSLDMFDDDEAVA